MADSSAGEGQGRRIQVTSNIDAADAVVYTVPSAYRALALSMNFCNTHASDAVTVSLSYFDYSENETFYLIFGYPLTATELPATIDLMGVPMSEGDYLTVATDTPGYLDVVGVVRELKA